jgi:membrane fusion protein (multidrug efflux system)
MNKIERIGGDGQPPLEPEPRSERREAADARDARRGAAGAPGSGTTAPERRGRRRLIIAIGAVILIAAIILIWSWWENSSRYETTDDAFIDTHIVRLSPQIAGRVVRVLVNDNQLVQPGALLVEIDAGNARTGLEQVQAQQGQAEAQLLQARSQMTIAQHNYEQALSNAAAAAVQAQNAQTEANRYRELQRINPQAVASQQLDQAVNQASNLAHQRDAAQQEAQAQSAQRQTAAAQAKAAQATLDALKAQVQQAQLNVGYERVVAPIAGHVAQRNVATGNYVMVGQELMAIVPLQMWVTANFKETQLAYMRPGQQVTLHVDACPNSDIRGHVDSIQRGAGQAFGILPPENATGNFVKVVQRVPVKIDLDTVPADCPLGPGMSVEPSVRVR